MAVVNVLFTTLFICDGWRVGHSRLLLGLLIIAAGALAYRTVTDSIQTDREIKALADWPEFETLTLLDGWTIKVAPPPGYIRVAADNPAVNKYLKKFLYGSDQSQYRMLAVFAESERRYKEIIKNLERLRCDYNCISGLAWVYEKPGEKSYAVIPDKTLAEQLWSKRNRPREDPGSNATGPAFYLDDFGHRFSRTTVDGLATVDCRFSGRVIVSGHMLHSVSNYNIDDWTDDERRQRVDHSRRWLEALAAANPEPPEGLRSPPVRR